jgi:5'-3' exonuclease
MEESIELVIIDADSMVHRVANTTSSPALGRKAIDKSIESIIEFTEAESATIFMKGENNFRYDADPNYKGHRKDTIAPEIKERIEKLYAYMADFCVVSDDGEADDYCAILAHEAEQQGMTYIVSHIDKDLNCIPGWHHNFRTNEIYYVKPEEGYAFLMQQLISGDGTDGIKGIKGLGPVKAGKIVNAVPVYRMWDEVINTWTKQGGDNWKNEFVKCANCIYLRTSGNDLRPLTFEELKERLTWKTAKVVDIGLTSQKDALKEPSDSSTPSSDQQEDNTSEESR